ncbi:uncharacterized protein LOC6542394 [Drosophila erecta]|uniref:Lipid-binding serum glycoprotein N-terminal domain-containing protein n=1 Tax=Drosophila erecta TaxID=7220 RepID=B3N324_DROER|nr:uncharacterized protein LOC6542394 [Drosophila erecta]EDV57623.1 uncharacterized protein Dere_GG24439 [Drosophila erecta]
MKPLIVLVLVGLLASGCHIVHSQDPGEVVEQEASESDDALKIKESQANIAAQVEAMLVHFQQEDPQGLPGVPVPDPLEVPNVKKSMGMANLDMKQVKAYGLSKFRIDKVNLDLKEMKFNGGLQLDQMLVKGQYTLSSFFSKANGPFTVVLKNVYAEATAFLAVERDGQLATDRIKIDITFSDMTMDFQNLGLVGSVFQSVVNGAPNLVFDAMKPFMLQEADKKLRSEINVMIQKTLGDRRLPNSITPLDSAIAMARKMVRQKGYDPYHLPDVNRTMGVFSVQLAHTWINGISSFYRVGNITAGMANKTVSAVLQIGTQQVTGAGQWEVGVGMMTRVGHVQFTVQHIRATVGLSQSLDTRQRAQITDLQFDMGNIQVRCDGAGTLDYVMEFAVNVIPNLLRYQIMDAIENPIKQRVQEKFNTIDVEQVIKTMAQNDFNFDPTLLGV